MKTLVAFLALAALLTAAPPPPPPADSGFRTLFNGKDLTGWHVNKEKIGHGTGGKWEVEKGGVIAGSQNPPGNGGILLTDEKFGDFEIILETMPDWRGPDSGLFLRSTETGKCYQVMIDYHENGNVGEIYREGLDGKGNGSFSLTGIYADAAHTRLTGVRAILPEKPRVQPPPQPMIRLEDFGTKIWKVGKWNEIRARITGNPPTIETWVNGHQMTRYTSDQKFEGILGDTGSIAVQVHGSRPENGLPPDAKVRFRKIRIKTLGGGR